MTRWLLVVIVFLGSVPVFADSGTGSSHFHLLNMKCEQDSHEGVETSPQSPPLDVDDPATPGCNQWEINVVASGDVSLREKKYELPLLDINYGIGDNLQLKYEVPNVNSQTEGTTVSGVGNSKAGLKYMFFENEDLKMQMAFYPQVEFLTPSSGAEEKGLETSGTITTLPFLLSQKIGQLSSGDIMMTTNLGYNISAKPETRDYVSFSAGVGMPLSGKVSAMGELSTEQAVSKNSDGLREQLLKANVGMIVSVYKQFSVFGSMGRSLYSTDENSHTYFLTGIRI